MMPASDVAYMAAVLVLYTDLPATPIRPSQQDQVLARRWHEQGVSLSLVESALLLGSLRRLTRPPDAVPRPPDAVPLPPIRSLAYFQPIIAELQQQPLPTGYLDYLRLKLRKIAHTAAG